MSKPVHVTDHALVRYLERVRGFKFDKERAEIQRVCAGFGDMDFATINKDGFLYEIVNGSVVTIAPRGYGPSKTKRRLRAEKLEGRL